MNRPPAFAIEKAMLMGRNPFYLAKIIDRKDSDAENDQMEPVTRLSTMGGGFIGKSAATCAKTNVLMTQMISASVSGSPPMAK